jgi:hypothetical protein
MAQTRRPKRPRRSSTELNSPKRTKSKQRKVEVVDVENVALVAEDNTEAVEECEEAHLHAVTRCREAESQKLLQHLKEAVCSRQGTALYVPGQPGTGKTLTVSSVLSNFPWQELREPQLACTLVNCMDSSSCLARVCLAGLQEAAASLKGSAASKQKGTTPPRAAFALPVWTTAARMISL